MEKKSGARLKRRSFQSVCSNSLLLVSALMQEADPFLSIFRS